MSNATETALTALAETATKLAGLGHRSYTLAEIIAAQPLVLKGAARRHGLLGPASIYLSPTIVREFVVNGCRACVVVDGTGRIYYAGMFEVRRGFWTNRTQGVIIGYLVGAGQ